jgi:glycosyltransferase involved in cell wall biosynthesis
VPYIEKQKIEEYAKIGRLNRLFGKRNPVKILSCLADSMIVYSEHAKEYFRNYFYFKKPIQVAPNSPDTDLFLELKEHFEKEPHEIDNLRQFYAPNGEKVILMLGRLNRDRKADLLIAAFSRIKKSYKDSVLIIIGDGSEKSNLEKLVNELNIYKSVYFAGEIYDELIQSKYFMLCDVFVCTGVASMALKIALTFGKPVVSVGYGLEIHIIKDNWNGLIAKIDNSDSLAEKIELLLKDREYSKIISDNGFNTIKEYVNINKMIEGFQKAIIT